MIKFYINDVKQDILLAPTMTTTQDETLDSATIVLKANTIATPYAPMQACRIEIKNDKFFFYIATDEVTIYSLEKGLYQHKLTLTQNIRKLSKYMMRNTVFSQPANKDRKGYCSVKYNLDDTKDSQPVVPYYLADHDVNSLVKSWNEALVVGTNEKVYRTYYKVTSLAFSRHGAGDNQYFYDGEKKPFDFLRDTATSGLSFVVNNDAAPSAVSVQIKANTEINKKYYDSNLDEYIKTNGAGKYKISLRPMYDSAVALNPNTPEDNLRQNTPLVVILNVEIGCEVYTYTAYDVLDIINKQFLKTTLLGNKHEPLYEMPQPLDPAYKILTTTIVPDMTFTQCTYFEAVSQVYKLFDAIFTIETSVSDFSGKARTLGIEYLNRKNELLQGKKYVGRTIAIGEDKYNNGLVSYFQNALLEDKFPSGQGTAPARSMVLGVPEKENSWAFITPHPIDLVKNVKVAVKFDSLAFYIVYGSSGVLEQAYFKNFKFNLDITPFVFETSVWSLLNSTDQFPLNGDFQNLTQNGTLTYTRGTNRINLSYFYVDFMSKQSASFWNVITNGLKRTLGKSNFTRGGNEIPSINSWDQIRMSCEYQASLDGRVKVESIAKKYEGEMLSNQGNGAVDLAKLGLNMIGLATKLGEPTLSLNQERVTWDNAIKKGQYFLDEFNNEWVANVCNYIFYNDFVSTNIQFVKNFNGLAQYVKVDREKRLTNISSKLTMKCEDDLCEYLYLSSVKGTEPNEEISIFNNVNKRTKLEMLAQTFNYTIGQTSNKVIGYTELITKFETYVMAKVYIPLVKYGSGNALCFEMSMDDPYSAGNQTKLISKGWFGEKNYFTKIVPYTNENGFFDKCDILFVAESNNAISNTYFPDLSNKADNDGCIGKLQSYCYYKKPNEIFALNYEIVCLPFENRKNIDFVGKEFIKNNGLIKGINSKRLFFYYMTSEDAKYSISTQKGLYDFDDPLEITSIEIDEANFAIKFKHDEIFSGIYYAWSICDEEGNIYFASNEPQASMTENVLYFNARLNRL